MSNAHRLYSRYDHREARFHAAMMMLLAEAIKELYNI
jgi:hypothetical protein